MNKKEIKDFQGIISGTIIILIFLVGLLIYFLNQTTGKLFGLFTFNMIFAKIIFSISLFGTIYFAIFLFNYIRERKMNHWLIMTICLIGFLFISGYLCIPEVIEQKNLDSFLRNKNDGLKIEGNLECYSSSNYYEIDEYITCEIKRIKTQNYTARVIQYTDRDITREFEDENNIYFFSDKDTDRIVFQINVTDEDGNFLELETTRKFSFISKEESQKIKDKTVQYIIGLLAVILFSVPAMMVNLRSLYRNKN